MASPVPHFTQIKSSRNRFEPIWKNLFEIQFILPDALTGKFDTLYLLENAKSVNVNLTPEIATAVQRYKYSTRAFKAMPEKTHIDDLQIGFNVLMDYDNNILVWTALKAWYDLVWNSQTGELTYKPEHCGTIIVTRHDRKGNTLRSVVYHNVMISSVSGNDLAWDSSTEIDDVTGTFVADYFEDLYKRP